MSCVYFVQWATGYLLPVWRHRTHVARLSAQGRITDDDASEWKTNLGTTGRSGYSEDGDKRHRPRKVRHDWQTPWHPARLPDQQHNDGVSRSAMAVMGPTVIAIRMPRRVSREADKSEATWRCWRKNSRTHIDQRCSEGLTVPSLHGLAVGIVMAEQRNQAKTRTAAQDEDYLPCLRNFPGHLCSQRDPNSGIRKDLSWRRPRLVNAVSAAVRQDWTITRCQEHVRFDRRYIASLCADYASCS